MSQIIRIGGAALDEGDETATSEETSIRLSDGGSRVRIATRMLTYGSDRSDPGRLKEQNVTSIPREHLPMIIAALQMLVKP